MKKSKEKYYLFSILRNIDNANKPNTLINAFVSIFNIGIFAIIAYMYMSVKDGRFEPTLAIVVSVVLAIFSGIITMYKHANLYKRYSALYIDKEKVEKRLNEIST
jgi:hypothetical protein